MAKSKKVTLDNQVDDDFDPEADAELTDEKYGANSASLEEQAESAEVDPEDESAGDDVPVHNSEQPRELVDEDAPAPHERLRTAWEEPGIGEETLIAVPDTSYGQTAPDEPDEADEHPNQATYGSAYDDALARAVDEK